MILQDIRQQIKKHQQNGTIFPLYPGYCFSNIPLTIEYLFGLRSVSPLAEILNRAGVKPGKHLKIVLLLIDGFGYNQWLKYYARYEFLLRLTQKGIIAPLTTIFPSTTAAALTTIHTGLTPQEHGLPEWTVYFEELDRIIQTLPFRDLGTKTRDQLLTQGVDPKMLYSGNTVYQRLAEANIPAYTFSQDLISHSAYSKLVQIGSESVNSLHWSDLLVNLRWKIESAPAPAYFYVYSGAIDEIVHAYGLHTEQYLAELDGFFNLLQQELIAKLSAKAMAETIILVTADHGLVNTDPAKTIYLSQDPDINSYLRISPRGNRILPWGSARDIFIAALPDKLDLLYQYLRLKFEDQATLIKIDDAIERHLFGSGRQHAQFRGRVGDILMLPRENGTIWYEHYPGDRFELRGMHGGLSPDEMLVPLAVANLSNLT
jgi:predicted AlkP superfamily pyrophosphatase or phosphodiesterase